MQGYDWRAARIQLAQRKGTSVELLRVSSCLLRCAMCLCVRAPPIGGADMAASHFIRSGTGSGTHMRSRPPFQTSVPDLAEKHVPDLAFQTLFM